MKTTVVDTQDRSRASAENLKWVERISHLMDSKYTIPKTKIKFGLDPILSLIPVLGDLVTYVVSGVLIYTMYNHGASRKLVVKMIINATLDAILGAIPLIGTIFDTFFKANERNVKLLREHYEEGKHTGSGKGLIIITAILLILVVAGVLFLVWKVLEALFQFIF